MLGHRALNYVMPQVPYTGKGATVCRGQDQKDIFASDNRTNGSMATLSSGPIETPDSLPRIEDRANKNLLLIS